MGQTVEIAQPREHTRRLRFQGAILQGLEAWSIAWVGGGKLVSIALKTSPIDVNGTGSQFILQVALPILPVDRLKTPGAAGQSTASLIAKLLISASLEVFLFVPLTRDLAAKTWEPHPVVEAVIVCALLLNRITRLPCCTMVTTHTCYCCVLALLTGGAVLPASPPRSLPPHTRATCLSGVVLVAHMCWSSACPYPPCTVVQVPVQPLTACSC